MESKALSFKQNICILTKEYHLPFPHQTGMFQPRHPLVQPVETVKGVYG